MRRTLAMLLLAYLATTTAHSAAPDDAVRHNFQRWQYVQEALLTDTPDSDVPQYCDFVLPVSVFNQAREDLGDLRLLDADGIEIPYALRVRRKENSEQSVNAPRLTEQTAPTSPAN